MKKKYLSWFFSSKSINGTLATHSFLINKLCEKFDKIYLINLKYIELDLKKKLQNADKFSYEVSPKFHLPDNAILINPLSVDEFKKFISKKELISININNFGTNLPSLKLLLFLNRFSIRNIEVNDIANIAIPQKIEFNYIIKGLIFKLNKIFYFISIFILNNLRLIKKTEIKFTANLNNIKSINQNILKKILYKLNLLNYKKIITINSKAFDLLNSNKLNITEDKIVLLDDHFGHPSSLALRGKIDQEKIDKHYKYLINLITDLSNKFNKEIVVCIHPKDDLEFKKKIFPNFSVVKFETRENILNAFIVLFFESSAITDAILLKKNIITIYSEFMDKNVRNGSNHFKNNVGVVQLKLSNNYENDTNNLVKQFDIARKKFDNYISHYIAPDKNKLGYEKLIKKINFYFFK